MTALRPEAAVDAAADDPTARLGPEAYEAARAAAKHQAELARRQQRQP